MKEKAITIVLTILIIVVPIIAVPTAGKFSINLLKIIALLTCGILLLILLLINYKKLEIDRQDIILLIFGALVFISTMFSSNVQQSVFGAPKRYEGMLTFFTYILIFFCTKKFLKYKNENTLIKIAYIIYITVCTLGIAQYFVKCKTMTLYPIFRNGICGTFGNTNFMGSFLSIGIPIFSIYFITKGTKLSFITSLMIFFCMVGCVARSSWVAFAGAFVVIIIYLIKTKNKKFVIRAIVLFSCFVFIFCGLYLQKSSKLIYKVKSMSKEVKTAITTQNISDKMGSGRIKIWKICLELVEKYPILGVGTDNLFNGIANNLTETSISFFEKTPKALDKAHNEYLHIATTMGIPTLIIYLLYIYIVINPRDIFKTTDMKQVILYTSIVSYLIQAFFNISTIGVAPIFYMILGLYAKENEKLKRTNLAKKY